MEAISLKELQSLTLELLAEFDAFCEKNNIEYVLGGGSLLGAVRHKGFIPWDDDADVMMMRDQYERFLDLAYEQGVGEDRKVVSTRDKSFARNYARYVRTDYRKDEEQFVSDDCPWVGIDVFPIDYVSSDIKEYEKQVKKIARLRKLLLVCVTEIGSGKTKLKAIAKNIIRPFAKRTGAYGYALKLDREGQRFSNGDRKYIAALCGMYGMRERWLYSDYVPKIKADFENKKFPIPANYNIYLSNLYGDYMKLPPEDKRKYSTCKVFKIEK